MSFLRLKSWAGRSALLMGGLLLHSAGMSLNAQIQRTPGALSMGSSLGFGAAFPVVKNEPYTANVVMQIRTLVQMERKPFTKRSTIMCAIQPGGSAMNSWRPLQMQSAVSQRRSCTSSIRVRWKTFNGFRKRRHF